MVEISINTDDMSRERLVELLILKEVKLSKSDERKIEILKIYDKYKVSDTFKINTKNHKKFIEDIEMFLQKLKYQDKK